MRTRLSSLFRRGPAPHAASDAPDNGTAALPVLPGLDEIEAIGSGGFSKVFKARQAGFDRFVAVKVLNIGLESVAQRRSFERECRALGALSQHPNIVTVFNAAFTADGRPAIVMEYYGRGTLGELVKIHGPLDVDAGMSLGVQMAGALETAHRNGVVHRDIKPNNLFVSEFGQPALGDFGISSFVDDRTITGGGGGLTVHYAPPELIEGDTATPASDVYSLAATLYTVLAGRRPFPRAQHQSIGDLARRILIEPAPRLPVESAPPALIEALRTAMAKNPSDRHGSAAEFGEALQQVQQASGWATTVLPLTVDDDTGLMVSTAPSATPIVPSRPTSGTPATSGRGAEAVVEPAEPTGSDDATRTIVRSRSGGVNDLDTHLPQAGPDTSTSSKNDRPTQVTLPSARKIRGVAIAALFVVAVVATALIANRNDSEVSDTTGTTVTTIDDDSFFSAPRTPTAVAFSATADPLVFDLTWYGLSDDATYQVERIDGDRPEDGVVTEFDTVPASITLVSNDERPCVVVRAVGANGRTSADSEPVCLER